MYASSAFNRGYRIGSAFRRPEESPVQDTWVMKQLMENAYGAYKSRNGTIVAPAELYPDPRMQAVVRMNYLKKETEARKELWNEKKSLIEMSRNLNKDLLDVEKYSDDPATMKVMAQTKIDTWKRTIPDKELLADLGFEESIEAVTNMINSSEAREKYEKDYRSQLSKALINYRNKLTPEALDSYTILRMDNPELADKWGLPSSTNLNQQYLTNKQKENEREYKRQLKQDAADIEVETSRRKQVPGKPSASEEQIARLQKSLGISEEDAVKIVDGVLKIQKDPVTQDITLVDLSTNEARKLSVADEQTAEPPPQRENKTTIWNSANLSTGLGSSIKQGASVVSGMVGGPIFEETVRARQFVQAEQNNLIRALSINPRFPVGEIKRIREEIKVEPNVFASPEILKERLLAIEESLLRRIEKEMRSATDTSLAATDRRNARKAIVDMQNFVEVMGIPVRFNNEEEFNKGYDSLNPGDEYIDPDGNVRIKGGQ